MITKFICIVTGKTIATKRDLTSTPRNRETVKIAGKEYYVAIVEWDLTGEESTSVIYLEYNRDYRS